VQRPAGYPELKLIAKLKIGRTAVPYASAPATVRKSARVGFAVPKWVSDSDTTR